MSNYEEVGRGAVALVPIVLIAVLILAIFGNFINGCVYKGASVIGLGDLVENPADVEPEKETKRPRKEKTLKKKRR